MKASITAKRLEISGVVQGVGFRPFLFVLAKKYQLKGEVSNTAGGVLVIVEGSPENIKSFINDIYIKNPLLASVTNIETFDTEPGNFSLFQIVKSKACFNQTTLICPDVSICSDCLAEMKDSHDRRYEYPFINCTNCGPRYSIIEDIPYDRPKTCMKHFKMCAQCQNEYDDPMNRRFHAQPNACPECGPQVFLTDNKGKRIDSDSKEAITLAAQFLNQGKIVGVKGLGGFHLACDASNPDAVQNLRQRKLRPHKPFALMAESVSHLSGHVHVNPEEKELLESYPRPIVLLKKKNNNRDNITGLAQDVAPFNNSLGIMLPYTPLHFLLLEKGPGILVMTSGNRSGEPLSIENEDALDSFSHIADYFLLNNRDIYFRADDSIVRVQAGKPRFIRRSRGYAHLPVFLNKKMPKILGCGPGLKNTICLTRNSYAFLSQHIGDMDNVKAYDFYQNSIDHLKKILDIQPDIIAYDMHPGYYSTDYAKAQDGVKKIAVQHHHAHAAACMAENDLDEQVIAITLDGTGYGTDSHIWGGEILLCTQKKFKRKAHLSYIKMPGGDAAVLEPWRMAASVLYQAFGKDFLNLDIPYIKEMEKEKLSFVCQMMEKNLNSPLTSSAGRLFDAINIARENKDKEVVFCAVGFETTIPTIAAGILMGIEEKLDNFSIYSANKLTPPALAALMETDGVKIDGFILPGHVSVITGTNAYRDTFEKYNIPSVIAGFEPIDILQAVLILIQQNEAGKPALENAYPRAVSDAGNVKAKQIMNQVFEICDASWRGIGEIASSGMSLKKEYQKFDAAIKFDMDMPDVPEPKGCACGQILLGLKTPEECALYKKKCTPMTPVGPCMVSSEGSCAAFYRYS